MTKENFTSINIILDRSGSMTKVAADTIGGFNTFLTDQKKVEGEAVLTLATFSSNYSLIHDFKPLKDISNLSIETYQPSGYTALLDAIGRTITSVGTKLDALKEEEKPSKVIFVIMTDGEENYSREFTREKIFNMIQHQRDKYSWEFVFIGANQDAIKEGAHLGISMANSFNFTADAGGVASTYSCVSDNMAKYRRQSSAQVNFFDQGNVTKVDGSVDNKSVDDVTKKS